MLPSVRDMLSFSDCTPSQHCRSTDGSVDSESTDEGSRDNGISNSKRRPGRKAGSSDRYPVAMSARQYRCGVHSCATVFKRPEHLKRHMLTHTQVRPFRCEAKGCGKRFSRRDNYITHTKKHLLDSECPDTVSHRHTCSDINSGSSTTGSNTPARAESPVLPAVSNIFGLLNDCSEEQQYRPGTRQSWPSSSRTGSASPSASLFDTSASTVFLAPVLAPLDLLAQASLQSEKPPSQLPRRESRPLAVRVSISDDSKAVASFVEDTQSHLPPVWAPTTETTATGSSVEQFSATVVAGDPAKPFICSLCGSRFGRVEHVKRHHLVHTGQRKYECQVCLKSFARKDNMVQHLRSHERRDD
ncbi:hypothetical protein IWW37_003712 [Coemansia sp. RSA 2050]|nr:hypothetical protein IWW37_003712 [Coemansia sp. RSA 2050]